MNKDSLKSILSTGYDPNDWKKVLTEIFGVREFQRSPVSIPLPNNDLAEAAWELGSYTTSDDRVVGLYQVDLTDKPRIWQNRVGLRSLLKNVYKHDVDAALVVFVQNEKWRLSLISEIMVRDADGNVTEQKTEPKRFTYLLGKGETVRTPVERLDDLQTSDRKLETLIKAFSVEALNKDFFREYKVVFDDLVAEAAKQITDKETARLFAQRLLNRLMFLYFIQKKDWMRFGGNTDYLRSIFDEARANKQNFYRERLYYVFFYGLSNHAESKEIHNKTELEEIRGEAPYLNGGLFEPEKDGLDEKGKVPISNDIFEEILKLFERYNFTVDESTPFEIQVAVDPEMLGKVFEELVTGRHASGSYYTPRTVVSFMCREALKHALEGIESAETIAKLVDENDGKPVKNPEKILERLRALKVCDPACGSGAYLLGMLQELLHVREALFAATDIAKDAQYKWKREIIENNIYGVDLDRFATQIAALRLWLSLAIESDEPKPLPNLKYKIGCGDSLLAPLENDLQPDLHRRALIEQFRARKKEYTDADNHVEKAEAKTEIERLRVEIARTLHHLPEPPSPAKLILARNSIEPLRTKVTEAVKRGDKTSAEINQKKLNSLHADIAKWEAEQTVQQYDTGNVFDWSVEFAEVFEDGGFDVVLANPPYIKEDVNRGAFDGLHDSECYQGKMDIWYLFGCRSLDALKAGGTMCFVATNNWITSDGASRFRNKVLSQSRIVEMLDFGNHKIFTAAVQTMVFIIVKERPPQEYSVRYSRLLDTRASAKVLSEFLQPSYAVSNPQYLKYSSVVRPKELKDDYIRLLPGSAGMVTEKMIAQSNYRLRDTEIHSGIDVGQDAVSRKHLDRLLTTASVGDGIFVLSDAEKNAIDWNEGELAILKPYYTTKEINRYGANPQNRFWILYTRRSLNAAIDVFPNIRKHLDRFQEVITSANKPYGLHRTRDEQIFLGPKIFSTRKCASPTFSLVYFPCYVARTFLVIKPASAINQKYFLGLLNSRLVAFWLSHKGKMQGDQFQVDVVPLTRIPLILPGKHETSGTVGIRLAGEIERRVDRIIEIRTRDASTDISRFEREIDLLVYKLYDLTDAEIAIVEGRY